MAPDADSRKGADQPSKAASKRESKSGVIKLKKQPPKHNKPGNWRDGSVIEEDKSRTVGSPTASAASPGPVVNQLDDTARETFATGRPLEDSPDLQQCKHCKKSILKTAAKAHIAQCLKLKKEKAQRKKEAREARERAKEAAREEEARKADVENGDLESGDDEKKGNTAARKAGKKPEDGKKGGKKRKAEGELERGPKAKKKKDEPKAKVAKPKGPVDVERQCGVILPNGQPCARSLTCKSHSMGAKRGVAGRSLPYDMLLAAYQKKNQAKQQKAALNANAPIEDEDEANHGPVDSDEETSAVMSALSHWRPQPLYHSLCLRPSNDNTSSRGSTSNCNSQRTVVEPTSSKSWDSERKSPPRVTQVCLTVKTHPASPTLDLQAFQGRHDHLHLVA